MSSDFNLNHLADLARIELKKSEKKELNEDLKEILDYVNKLRDQGSEEKNSSRSFLKTKNSVREDLPPSNLKVKKSQKQDIKGQAPKTKDNYFVIPQVLKR